jgi:ribokinase
MNKICILGSINMDLVLKVDKMPEAGQTILSKEYSKLPGGKGANQAVAAQRLGANVCFIGKVGDDENGKSLLKSLKEDKIDVKNVMISNNNPTGMAIITVDDDGRNSIIVVPGANMDVDGNLIENAKDIIRESDVIITQFETPIKTAINAFKIAKENGVITILNPAPANKILDDLLKLTDIIVPNESETLEITGINVTNENDIRKAANKFIEKGVKFVIITLGERGAALIDSDNFSIIKAHKVKAIDTTAAGDSFIGALASKLKTKENINFKVIEEAVKFANKVSSIVVQRKGAQPSLPYMEEVIKIYGGE